MIANNAESAVWRWNRTEWLVKVYLPRLSAIIDSWSFSRPGPSYGVNHFRRQFLIPVKKFSYLRRLLGLPHHKNLNRVEAGRRAAAKHPLGRG